MVDVYRLEESLAALLDSRSTDLAYEKVRSWPGGAVAAGCTCCCLFWSSVLLSTLLLTIGANVTLFFSQ